MRTFYYDPKTFPVSVHVCGSRATRTAFVYRRWYGRHRLSTTGQFRLRMVSDEWPDVPTAVGKFSVLQKLDDTFVGINSRIVKTMDPLTRVLLERTYEAIIDAGILRSTVNDCVWPARSVYSVLIRLSFVSNPLTRTESEKSVRIQNVRVHGVVRQRQRGDRVRREADDAVLAAGAHPDAPGQPRVEHVELARAEFHDRFVLGRRRGSAKTSCRRRGERPSRGGFGGRHQRYMASGYGATLDGIG